MNDSLEIYHKGKSNPFCTLKSSFQPNDGDLINIEKVTYIVLGRSFTVDHASLPGKSIRCNVIVKRASKTTAATDGGSDNGHS